MRRHHSPLFSSQPLKLWVPEGVRSVEEKGRFDSLFGPFYRVEGVINLRNSNSSSGDLLQPQALQEMYWLFREVLQLRVGNVSYQDICARINPADPGSQCIWTSPLDFWWSDALNDWDLQLIRRSSHEVESKSM